MSSIAILTDGFERVRDELLPAIAGLTVEQLTAQPGPEANPMGWLAWHLTRVQDDHVAGVAGTDQVWTEDGWAGRFALPLDATDIGYGHTTDQVAAVVAGADLLAGYFAATHARTLEVLAGLGEDDLARIVDRRWDPPVTAAVRLVSVLADCLQHVGQIAYLRGLLVGG